MIKGDYDGTSIESVFALNSPLIVIRLNCFLVKFTQTVDHVCLQCTIITYVKKMEYI